MAQDKPIKFGVIGAGKIGTFHTRTLAKMQGVWAARTLITMSQSVKTFTAFHLSLQAQAFFFALTAPMKDCRFPQLRAH